MKQYRTEISPNPDLELIHISFDRTANAALKWAKALGQPWPILMQKDTNKQIFIEPYFPDGRIGVPTYILVDREGKEVARGKNACLSAAKKDET